MKILTKIVTTLCVFAFSVSLQAKTSPKIMVYTGSPLKIVLGVQSGEQRVTFPDTKVVWGKIKGKLKGKVTQLIVDNNVYWTAKKPFKTERFIIGEEGGTKIYLIDVSATESKVFNKRIIIKDGEDAYSIADKDRLIKPEQVIKPLRRKGSPTAGYATLFRCAAKQVYAPERLIKCPIGIYKQAIDQKNINNLVRYSEMSTRVVAAWRTGGLNVTALKISNLTNKKINLDPRLIRGQWKAALFMHSQLSPKGYKRDITTLFLISKKPFMETIERNPIITAGR